MNFHIKAGVACHGLDDHGQALCVRGRGGHECETGFDNAGFFQQRFGFFNVPFWHWHIFGIKSIGGRYPLVAYHGFIVHHDLGQALSVQRQFKGFTHFGITAQRILFGLLTFTDVDGDALITNFSDARDFVFFVLHEVFNIVGGHAFNEVELT